jgi:hypothetical protein
MAPSKKSDGNKGGVAGIAEGLAEQYQDSKDVLEYLTGTIFTELKGAASDAERDRQARLKQHKEQSSAVDKSKATDNGSSVYEELEERASGGTGRFWVAPETGANPPKSSSPPASPRSSRDAAPATAARSGDGGGSGGGSGSSKSPRAESPNGGGKKKQGNGASTAASKASSPASAAQLWNAKVAPVVGPVVRSLRSAMSRGPAYDRSAPEDAAAPPLANWPGRDADPKGWHARRKSYATAEQEKAGAPFNLLASFVV